MVGEVRKREKRKRKGEREEEERGRKDGELRKWLWEQKVQGTNVSAYFHVKLYGPNSAHVMYGIGYNRCEGMGIPVIC